MLSIRISLFFFLFNFFSLSHTFSNSSLYLDEIPEVKYTIHKLPDFSSRALNNKGQVVGFIGFQPNCNAVFWSLNTGLIQFPLEDNNSISYLINDNELVVVGYYNQDNFCEPRIMLWNPQNRKIITGPTIRGAAYFLTESNKVYLSNQQIWNAADNTLMQAQSPNELFNQMKKNKKGSTVILTDQKDIFFVDCKNQKKLLSMPLDVTLLGSNPFLNNKDEVIILANLRNTKHTSPAISNDQILLWWKNGILVRSQILSKIFGKISFCISGFNDNGQVLLCSGNERNPQSFLLSPVQK